MKRGEAMLFLLLPAALLLAGVQSAPEDNLSVGRPSLVSSWASPLPNCTTGAHLEVDAGVANITDDCGCVVTGGSTPPNLRDWYAVQLPAVSLVRAVRVSGISTPFDVLVGHDFSSNVSLSEFSVCARYNTADNAQNVSCTRALLGSVVVLRALNDTSLLRLCEVEVFGLAENLLRGSAEASWQLLPLSPIPLEEPWRLVDGDVSSCVDFDATARTAMKIRIPDGTATALRVFVYHQNVPVSAFSGDLCDDSRFALLYITNPSATGFGGTKCDFVQALVATAMAEFNCTCRQACQGELAISMTSNSAQLQWRVCEVVVTGQDVTSLPLINECAAPMGSVGVSGDMFDDISWSASSIASCGSIRFARFNFVPSVATHLGAWCPSTATPSWIALDLGTVFKLRAVIVQGSGFVGDATYSSSYVTSFSVRYALGQAAWTAFAPNGTTTVFSGPSHPSTPVLRSFSPELVASRIRLDVLQWVKYPCVRFELIGCPLMSRAWITSPIPALSGAFGIANSRITVTSAYVYDSHLYVKENIRLTSTTTCPFWGIWSPLDNTAGQWAELRLASSRTFHGIMWRGRIDIPEYVTTYDLQYKLNDSFALASIPGTPLSTWINTMTVVYSIFVSAFDAQTVRIIPATYSGWKSMRFELYVAPVRPTLISKKLDSPCPSGYRSLSGSGCYRFVNQTLNYTSADQFCMADGGHLARVTDYDEWATVSKSIPRQSSANSCAWIGGQNSSSNDSFRLPGTDQVLSVWDTTMPVAFLNATGSSALCLTQSSGFALSSAPVSQLHQFVCEKDQPSSPPTPVGLWPFNGFYRFRDMSPFRQHATAGSSIIFTGQKIDNERASYISLGYAYFDSTANAYLDVTMSSSVDLSRDLTLMFTSYLVSAGPVVYFRDPAGLVAFFGLKIVGTLLTVDFARKSDHAVYTCTSTVALSTYYTVAVTYNWAEGKGRLYVDGSLVASRDVGAGEQLLVSTQLRMGYSTTAVYSPATYTGYMSCLQLYDRVLRLHEMDTAMKRCGISTLQGVLGFWPMHGDLSNYALRQHAATSPAAQFVSGPPYSSTLPVSAVQTDGSMNSAVTVAGPLNVNGPFTLLLHTKTSASSGTILSTVGTTGAALSVSTDGSNVAVAIAGTTVATAPCFASGQWSQLVLRVDVTNSKLFVHCNSTQTISATLSSPQLTTAQSFTNLTLAPTVSVSLSCLLLLERVLTPLEIASYLFYCPFQPDAPFSKMSAPRRHCGDWRASGFLRSDLYVVDPDGADGPVEPFTVFCNMTDANDVFKAATVVRHMIAARTLVNGSAAALSVQFPISYEANATQMKALMAVSAHCRQWMQYECNGSAIYVGATQVAGWYSRMNDLQPGWAGVPSGTAGCACSTRGQCAGGATAKCNCDKDDAVWRMDAGWIEDMDLLPVSKLAFGDATAQNGFFTLGNLTCYG